MLYLVGGSIVLYVFEVRFFACENNPFFQRQVALGKMFPALKINMTN